LSRAITTRSAISRSSGRLASTRISREVGADPGRRQGRDRAGGGGQRGLRLGQTRHALGLAQRRATEIDRDGIAGRHHALAGADPGQAPPGQGGLEGDAEVAVVGDGAGPPAEAEVDQERGRRVEGHRRVLGRAVGEGGGAAQRPVAAPGLVQPGLTVGGGEPAQRDAIEVGPTGEVLGVGVELEAILARPGQTERPRADGRGRPRRQAARA
jgi:hypothetical protein